MLHTLLIIDKIIWLLFALCYAYQIFYLIYVLFRNKSLDAPKDTSVFARIAFVVSARNEENVIPNLIDSIHQQNYPSELIDIYVIADNCTDNTAEVARQNGAIVYERNNNEYVGKGYALDYLFKILLAEGIKQDAFIVLDADNIIDKNYVREMNKTFQSGYKVTTSYRNSKNYGANWISAGYSLWFLREAKYLNHARYLLNTSCAISGTGFLMSKEIVEKNNGWKYHLLTEDIEFTVDSAIHGEKIGYCPTAVLFDEQPVKFIQSWNQRLRWAKGFYQVIHHYGAKMLKTAVAKHSFSCFDMFMTVCPAVFLTIFSLVCNITNLIYTAIDNDGFSYRSVFSFLFYLLFCYGFLWVVGFITTITEWEEINCKPSKIILYAFTFPLFMLTYVPISITAIFKKVKWTPIEHTFVRNIDDVKKEKKD